MKRMIALAVCLLLVAAEADDKGKKADDPLVGTWAVEKMVVKGKTGPPLKGWVYEFADGKMTVKVGKRTLLQSYKTDPSERPAAIDITQDEGPDKGKTLKGVYEVKGDVLTLCTPAVPNGPRPKELVSSEDTILVSLKRDKGAKP
jgi:uncharacterized protein (TIGR03067 family)